MLKHGRGRVVEVQTLSILVVETSNLRHHAAVVPPVVELHQHWVAHPRRCAEVGEEGTKVSMVALRVWGKGDDGTRWKHFFLIDFSDQVTREDNFILTVVVLSSNWQLFQISDHSFTTHGIIRWSQTTKKSKWATKSCRRGLEALNPLHPPGLRGTPRQRNIWRIEGKEITHSLHFQYSSFPPGRKKSKGGSRQRHPPSQALNDAERFSDSPTVPLYASHLPHLYLHARIRTGHHERSRHHTPQSTKLLKKYFVRIYIG